MSYARFVVCDCVWLFADWSWLSLTTCCFLVCLFSSIGRKQQDPLKAGDVVKMHLGCHIDGYISVAAHTVIVPPEDGDVKAEPEMGTFISFVNTIQKIDENLIPKSFYGWSIRIMYASKTGNATKPKNTYGACFTFFFTRLDRKYTKEIFF